jgi:hypothetical protein
MTSETELRLAKEALVLDLFDSWPTASPSAENVRAYVQAVDAFSLEAVRRSVGQFQRGLVERNNAFVPAAPELAENCRQWEGALRTRADSLAGPVLHNGLLEVDYGAGKINLRGLTNAEQDLIMSLGGKAPDGRSMAGLSLDQIRQALTQGDLAAVEGGKSFAIPKLGRVQ